MALRRRPDRTSERARLPPREIRIGQECGDDTCIDREGNRYPCTECCLYRYFDNGEIETHCTHLADRTEHHCNDGSRYCDQHSRLQYCANIQYKQVCASGEIEKYIRGDRDERGHWHHYFEFRERAGDITARTRPHFMRLHLSNDQIFALRDNIRDCLELRWKFSREFHGGVDRGHGYELLKLSALYSELSRLVRANPVLARPTDPNNFDIQNCGNR